MMTACGYQGLIKQLDTRVTELSGFSNLMWTVGYSYFMEPDNSRFHKGYNQLWNFRDMDCLNKGITITMTISGLLEFSTSGDNYEDEVANDDDV